MVWIGMVLGDTEVMNLRFKEGGRVGGVVLTEDIHYPIEVQAEGKKCETYQLKGFTEGELLRVRMSWIGSVPVNIIGRVLNGGFDICYNTNESTTLHLTVENAIYNKFNFTIISILSAFVIVFSTQNGQFNF